MKEVEIKARLIDKEAVITKLASLGCEFEDSITQEDTVYTKEVGALEVFRSNEYFLRLRTKNGQKHIFTIKKRMKNDLDALEHETVIGSREEMEQALLMMGYKEAIRINKTRMITQHQGDEICIDDVEGLGTFIEMERLSEEGDSEKIQEELFGFFLELGIKPEDREMSGYDILMFQKNDGNNPKDLLT